jgi:hypothetical protein
MIMIVGSGHIPTDHPSPNSIRTSDEIQDTRKIETTGSRQYHCIHKGCDFETSLKKSLERHLLIHSGKTILHRRETVQM